MAASGVGALTGAVHLASRRTVVGLGRVVTVSAALFGVGLITFSQSRWLWLSLPLMFVTGLGMMQQMAASNTILQTIVDEEKRGRVMSYFSMAIVGMAPFGSLLAGSVAARIGAPRTLLVSGVCCVAGAAWFWMHLEEVRSEVRPIYRELGILPEIAEGLHQASALRTPPEE